MGTDKLEHKKIGIIGFGHMGNSLWKGLLKSGIKKRNIIISDKLETNRDVVRKTEYLFITVKPFDVQTVLKKIRDIIQNKIIISVAAGVDMKLLQNYSGNTSQKIIRLMPNIFISENSGCIGFYSNVFVNKYEKKQIIQLLSHLGTVIKVKEEKDINDLTILIGCAPGIISYFIESLTHYSYLKELEDRSLSIILESIIGTAIYLKKNQINPKVLIKSVATKGGITDTILHNLKKRGFKLRLEESLQMGLAQIQALKTQLVVNKL